jgi:hypothetical protein
MNKDITPTPGTSADQDSSVSAEVAASSTSRRRFSRNAIVGGAVMLSLGNRAAWATSSACLSPMLLQSYFNNVGGFTSVHGDLLTTVNNIKSRTSGNSLETLTADDGYMLRYNNDGEICASSCTDNPVGTVENGKDEEGTRVCPGATPAASPTPTPTPTPSGRGAGQFK